MMTSKTFFHCGCMCVCNCDRRQHAEQMIRDLEWISVRNMGGVQVAEWWDFVYNNNKIIIRMECETQLRA